MMQLDSEYLLYIAYVVLFFGGLWLLRRLVSMCRSKPAPPPVQPNPSGAASSVSVLKALLPWNWPLRSIFTVGRRDLVRNFNCAIQNNWHNAIAITAREAQKGSITSASGGVYFQSESWTIPAGTTQLFSPQFCIMQITVVDTVTNNVLDTVTLDGADGCHDLRFVFNMNDQINSPKLYHWIGDASGSNGSWSRDLAVVPKKGKATKEEYARLVSYNRALMQCLQDRKDFKGKSFARKPASKELLASIKSTMKETKPVAQ